MKTKIFSICLFSVIRATAVFAGDSTNLPAKVSELFHHSFPEVKNVTWYKVEVTYEAYFKKPDSSVCKIFYSRTGKLLYTFNYYSGEELPIFIKTVLAEKYKDMKILNVTEVYTDRTTIFYTILENKKWIYKVKLSGDGEIMDSETFLKG